MSFFIPKGLSGPSLSHEEVNMDSSIEDIFDMAEQIYAKEVTNFLNNKPGFRTSTSNEERAIYILARALQSYAGAYYDLKNKEAGE